MKQNWKYRRGDLYMVDLSPVCGSEQGGIRPVIVIQNNTGNHYSPTLIVAAITAQKEKKAGSRPIICSGTIRRSPVLR